MNDGRRTTLLDRTLGRLNRVWRDVARQSAGPLAGTLGPDLGDDDVARLRGAMSACLERKGGAVSARARAADLGRAYLGLDRDSRRRFLDIIAREFDVDSAAVDDAIGRFQTTEGDGPRRAAAADLRLTLVPPWVTLLMQFNALPDGIKFLIDLREELAEIMGGDVSLRALEADLKRLLASWFDVGFLKLHRITWESPAGLLEKLVAYEAVHEIRSWDDLKNRLDSDRRCFAFFHPNMADEPLIFVEVALVEGMADSIQALLDESAPAVDPEAADTAVFYSISNAQNGLAGINLGNFLIKQVVDELRHEFANLKRFATLSPMPGFRSWLDAVLADGGGGLLAPEGAKVLIDLLDQSWPDNPDQAEALRAPLMRLGAHYLIKEKRGAGARDPVENFHLTNGARLERINWLADTSAKGLRQSAGLMVNYLYRLKDIEANHEAYSENGRIVASGQARNLLKS